jgi:protein-S-isoprenylcysteine O-methyltransferase Ste14
MHAANEYAYGLWPVVLLNVLLVVGFVVGFLRPRRRADWRAMGVFSAWLVALFTEMYGVPLTIYALTALLGRRYPVLDPFTHKNGHLLVALAGGSQVVYFVVMTLTTVAFWVAIVMMERAWRRIHGADGMLVTDGLYARMRHPQYTAMFLLIGALLVQWPTLLTLLMAPVLVGAYVRLARREEAALLAQFGDAYLSYMRDVPAFLPRLWRGARRPGFLIPG